MTSYLIRRLLQTVPTVLAVTFIVFFMLHATGNPVTVIVGWEADEELRQRLTEEFGLDRPLLVQYVDWLGSVLQGDLGRSYRSGRFVAEEIVLRFPVTFWLTVLSFVFVIGLGVPLGIIAALRRNSVWDVVSNILSTVGLSTPNFVLGILLMYVFSLQLGLLPMTGYVSPMSDPWLALQHLLLPAFATGVRQIAIVARMTRSSMLEVLSMDYVTTARAKGISPWATVFKHAGRNALIPVVTVLTLQVGIVFGGSMVIETVFSLPGIGRMMVTNVLARDFTVVQGGMLILVLFVIASTLLGDILYALIDPRIQYD